MQNSNQFFATAKPLPLFLRVALPGMVSMLAMSIYLAFEGMFVGKFIGEAAFAAINMAVPGVMINNALADLIGVGSSVPISIALGRKDHARANNIFTCSILMIVSVAIISGTIIYSCAPTFIKLMGADGELAMLAVRYIRICALLGPFTTIVFAMDNYLRISGFVKGSMFLNIFMSLLTVVLLALFIIVMGMNVEGSAYASCAALAVCGGIAFIPFVRKKAILRFVRPHLSFALIREVVVCGAPTFLNNIAGRVAAIIMNASLLRIGGQTAVAAYSVLMYAAGLIEPMLYGMCDSIQPAVGFNWGAGALDRVRDITKISLVICGFVSILCTVAMCMFPKTLASFFVDPSETELMEMSVAAIPKLGIAFIFGWFGFAIQGFFAAIEKSAPATILSVCRAMVFPVILIYALSFLGLDGLWLNYAGTSFLAVILAIVMLCRVQKTMRRDIMIHHQEQEALL